jgi:hypothetical protein
MSLWYSTHATLECAWMMSQHRCLPANHKQQQQQGTSQQQLQQQLHHQYVGLCTASAAAGVPAAAHQLTRQLPRCASFQEH